jgi:hypothetical protein
MNTPKHTLFEAILARISFGAVPVDGAWWFDPKDAGATKSCKPAAVPDADWSPGLLPLSQPLRRS